jgi:integrase/recombinase XerD
MLKAEKSRTTIKMYMECIRTLMNDAKADRIILEGQYPFGKRKFEIKKGTGRKLALSLSQIKAVMQFPLLTENEKRMRDLWFFSYMTNGINFSDMLRLKYSDLIGEEIHFSRKKTIRTAKVHKEIIAPVLPEMRAIIEKWGNPDIKHDNNIFPFLRKGMSPIEEKLEIQNVVRLCNKKMTKISEALGLPSISTYTARHSFATVLKRSGANIAFISESLGHTDIRTTENYLSSFEQKERLKNASLLTDFDRKTE